MKQRVLLIVSSLLLLSGAVHATSVKIYGVATQADLTALSPVTPNFSLTVCDRINTTSCNPSGAIQWTVADANQDGRVDNPNNGMMDGEGWMYANQIIKLTNLVGNTPDWTVQIHTSNTVTSPIFIGSIPHGGTISGLVSQDGLALLPLSWQVLIATKTITAQNPFPEAVAMNGFCGSTQMSSAGFCDFATHFMNDVADLDTNGHSSWWENINNNPTLRERQENYQSVLRPDGIATGDFYRLAYPTLGGATPNGPYYLYIGALFSNALREIYHGTLRIEIVTQ